MGLRVGNSGRVKGGIRWGKRRRVNGGIRWEKRGMVLGGEKGRFWVPTIPQKFNIVQFQR